MDHALVAEIRTAASVPQWRTITRTWLRDHGDCTETEVRGVIGTLLAGESDAEKVVATMLVRDHPGVLRSVTPGDIDKWLEHLAGWAQVDSLCQSSLSADHLLADWPAWRKAIRQWATNANINKRRASLVLLTGPVHYSDDVRLRDLAFETITELQRERPILITKAISWLLRAMTTRHPEDVVAFLAAHEDTLPKIALRETRTKLATGTKSGRSRSRPADAASLDDVAN
jgi:3-methyladenine DNA glycosylase AlkD